MVPLIIALALPLRSQDANAAPDPAPVSGGDMFMTLAPMQVTVVTRGRPRGVLSVDLGIEVPDADLRARVRSGMPRLRDHMLRSVSLFATSTVDFTRPVDVARLAGRLQAIADAYAADKTIKVLLINVSLYRR